MNASTTDVLSGQMTPDDNILVFKLDKPVSFFLETLTYAIEVQKLAIANGAYIRVGQEY